MPLQGVPLEARYSGLLFQLVIPLPISSCFSLFAVVMTPLEGGGSSLGAVFFLASCGYDPPRRWPSWGWYSGVAGPATYTPFNIQV